METIPSFKYQSYLNIHIEILRFSLYWPNNEASKMKRRLYKVYSVTVFFLVYVLYGISETMYMILARNNFNDIIKGFFLFITNTIYFVKLFFLVKKNDLYQEIVRNMGDEVFQPKRFSEYLLSTDNMRGGKRITLMLIIVGLITWAGLATYPIVYHTKESTIVGWFPFNKTRSPQFELTHAYQASALLLHELSHTTLDSLTTMVFTFICGQLDSMNEVLINLRTYAIEHITNQREEVCEDTISKEMNALLINCVQKHWKILK